MTAEPAEAPEAPSEEEEVRAFVKYTFFHLRPEWRRLPASEREAGREAFLAVLERPPPGLALRTYSLVGLKAGTELMLWTIAPHLDPIQEIHARILGTPLGGYLDTTYSYLGMGRPSEYLGSHAHGGEGGGSARHPADRKYLFVYPFVKKREWYGLPMEARRKSMAEHFRIGHKYPKVVIHTGYSFGLDDMEFILAFEADSPAEFLDLVHDLRPSEASRYTELETPIFTCALLPPRAVLAQAEGTS